MCSVGRLYSQLCPARVSPRRGEPPKSEIVVSPLKVEEGFLIVPDAPGLGVELAEDAQERHPYRPRVVRTRLHVDGSVVDQ